MPPEMLSFSISKRKLDIFWKYNERNPTFPMSSFYIGNFCYSFQSKNMSAESFPIIINNTIMYTVYELASKNIMQVCKRKNDNL